MARSANISRWGQVVFNGLGDAVAWTFTSSSHLSIALVWALVSMFYLVNADAVLGSRFAETVRFSIAVYLILVGFFYATQRGVENPLSKISTGAFLLRYAIIFMLSALVASAVFYGTGFHPPELPVEASTNAVLFFIVFLIAFPEELIFRDAIPHVLQHTGLKNPFAAQLISAVFFSLFHFKAYNGNVAALIFAFVAGLVFGLVREGVSMNGTRTRNPNGLVAAIALHSMYNAAVFGVFCATCGGLPF